MEKQEYQGYIGVWRRLKSGAAIFIRDGEDIKSAVRRNYNSQKLENKKKEIVQKDYRAFENEQAARKDKMIALREKGELSKEYDDAFAREKNYKKEQEDLRQQRYAVEDEQQRVTSRNRFGMQIKKDQVDRLKEVGNVKKNQAEFEDAYLKMVDKNKSGSEDEYFANSERFNATEKKYRDLYGQEESNEMLRRSFETYKKGVEGSILTKQMTPKQKAEEIKKANSYTSQELKDKYGTDNVDLINAGKEKEDRATLKKDVNDKDIEDALRSLYTYKNEKGMGSLDKDPFERYNKLYGKENVDRVWEQMGKKYDVIEGTTVDSEGLMYNTIVEKDKYSPYDLGEYKKTMYDLRKEYKNNRISNSMYNERANQAWKKIEESRKSSEAAAKRKDLTYEEFLKKHFGHEIDRMDLSEEDDDALYQEWLNSKKKK